MKTVLFITEAKSVELAKLFIEQLSSEVDIIGKLIALQPVKLESDPYFELVPTGAVTVPTTNIARTWDVALMKYSADMELGLLPELLMKDKYDFIIAVNSTLADRCLLGKAPGDTSKHISVRGVPRYSAGFAAEELSAHVLSANHGHVDAMLVPTKAAEASIVTRLPVSNLIPIEVVDFPVVAESTSDRAAIRNTIQLPTRQTIGQSDIVITTWLPSNDEFEIFQPNIHSLVEVMHQVNNRYSSQNAPRWIVMAAAERYRTLITGQHIEQCVRDNMVLFGKKGHENHYFRTDAIAAVVKATDYFLDMTRDGDYNLVLESMLAAGVPTLSHNAECSVGCEGATVFGYHPAVDNASEQLRYWLKKDPARNKPKARGNAAVAYLANLMK